MISIFESNEKNFNNNGIKILKPLQALITKEDNGNYYLDLKDTINNIEYYQSGRIVRVSTPWGKQGFRLSNPKIQNRYITCRAYHLYFDTKNYLIEDSYVVGKNCNDALDHLNNACDKETPFSFISDIQVEKSYRCVRKSLEEAISVVIERWGGHLVRDNFNIEIRENIGEDRGIVLSYGKNITNITSEEKWDDVVTKILPVGKDGLELPEKYIEIEEELYDIPYSKVIEFSQDISEDDYKDENDVVDEERYHNALIEDLRIQAQNYLMENKFPKVNYSVSAYIKDVSDVGDTIYILHPKCKINIITNVIAIQYDCILEKYVKIEFGNFRNKLKDLIPNLKSNITQNIEKETNERYVNLQKELKEATDKINNAMSNSFVIYDGSKILIVNKLPAEEAEYAILINNGGIGFSQHGINGPFDSAWTIDGTLDMQNINVINLVADMIKGGTLKLGGKSNVNGKIEIYNSDGELINIIDNNGLMFKIDGQDVTIENFYNTTNQKFVDFTTNLDGIQQQVAYFNDQSQAIAKLTTSIEGIEAQIGSITDTTVSANGIGNITLKNVLTSELLYLQIYPTKEDLSYLNISPKTGLGNNTKLTSRDLLFLKDPKNVFNGKLENGSIDKNGENGVSPELDTTTYIELKEKLNSINDVSDEYDIISGKGIKRIGEYICTGDEDIQFESNRDGNYIRARFLMDNVSKESKRQPILSNYFKYALTIHDVGTGFISFGYFYFYLPKEYTTKEQYVQWLKDRYNEGNPLKIQYVLETPEEITTEPVNIQLRKGYNKIEIKDKNGLLNKTKLSYLADTEKTVDGTNSIIIEDAEPVNVRSLIVYGNSYQETRSGKNLYNYTDKKTVTSGITTDEDGWITINGDNQVGTYYNYYTNNLNLKENTDYAIVLEIKSVSGTGRILPVSNTSTNGQFENSIRYSLEDLKSGDTKIDVVHTRTNFENFTNGLRTYASFTAGQSGSITFRISVIENISIIPEQFIYEPYGAMPSLEFPSEVKCVDGLGNLFDLDRFIEEYNKVATSPSYKENGFDYFSYGDVSHTGAFAFKFMQGEFKENTQYTLCVKGFVNNYASGNFTGFIFYYTDNTHSEVRLNSGNLSNYTFSSTANKTINYIGLNSSGGKGMFVKDICLYEDNMQLPYLPYGKSFLQLVDTGKNLFDKNVATKGWILNADTGEILRNGSYFTSDYIPVKPNNKYTFTGFQNYYMVCFDKDKNYIGYMERSNTSTTLPNTVFIRASGLNTDIDLAQIEEGEEATYYEPYVANKVRNTEKFAIEKTTYTIDLNGATDVYLFFYDENDNLISKSGYHKLPYTFNNTDAKYVRFMFKDVNNDNLNADDIKNLTIYDVNANEPAIRYTLPCNLYYINDEIKDELIIDYEKEQTFVIKRVGINAETGEKYALETARTDFYKYVGIDFVEDGNYLIKMESFTTAYINARALANSIYTAQYPTRVEVNNAIKLSEEGIRQEVNGKVTDLNGNVKELKGSLELKLNTKDLCTELNGSADKISFIGDRFSWKSTYSSMTDTGTLKATNVDLTGKITATSGTIGGCSISSGVLKVADANITSINASKITAGTMSADRISGGTIDATKTTVKNLNATNITSGTIDASKITVKNINATNITSGTIDASKITVKNLNASNITSGTISTSRLASNVITTSNLSAQKISANQITTGTLSANRISGGTISGNNVSITNINASNITGGSMSMSRISGGTLNVGATGYYLRVGVGYTHPTVSGLNVTGGGGINLYGSGISNCYTVANGDDLYLASNSGTVHLGHGSSGSGHPVEVFNSMVYLNQAVDVTTNSFYVRKVDGTRLTLSAYINEASSIKMKENILPINKDFINTLYQEVKDLKLYSFDYIKNYINDDVQRKNKYGFMIEDIKEKNIGKLLDIEENNDIALYSGKGLAKLNLILIKMLIEKIEKLESR